MLSTRNKSFGASIYITYAFCYSPHHRIALISLTSLKRARRSSEPIYIDFELMRFHNYLTIYLSLNWPINRYSSSGQLLSSRSFLPITSLLLSPATRSFLSFIPFSAFHLYMCIFSLFISLSHFSFLSKKISSNIMHAHFCAQINI
jgi:hypothetical protein